MLPKEIMLEIELEEPFKSKWQKAYLFVSTENRKTVIFSSDNRDNSITTYARYLYGVYLGYEVPSHLQVDHINNDKTDDRLENLQLLTLQENRLKEYYNYIMNKQIVYGVYCSCCGSPFLITQRQLNMKLAQNVHNAYCSRECAYVHNLLNSNSAISKISQESIATIKRLRYENKSSYEISRITGFARNTVMKYW